MTTMTTRNFYNQRVCNKEDKPKRIYCYDCQCYSESVEPIIVRRYHESHFHVAATCSKCGRFKSCVINDFSRVKFPSHYFDETRRGDIFLNYVNGKRMFNEIYSIINGRNDDD